MSGSSVLGSLLRSLRVENGYSLRSIEQETKLSRESIRRYETEPGFLPSDEALHLLLPALGVTIGSEVYHDVLDAYKAEKYLRVDSTGQTATSVSVAEKELFALFSEYSDKMSAEKEHYIKHTIKSILERLQCTYQNKTTEDQ